MVSSGSRDATIHHHDARVGAHQGVVAELLGHSQEVCARVRVLEFRVEGLRFRLGFTVC